MIGLGGSAGSGKSEVALGLALTEHNRSIFYRRHYKDLEFLENRARGILNAAGIPFSFNGSSHVLKCQTYDARLKKQQDRTIQFAHLQKEDDWELYAGRPYDLIVFDETPQLRRENVLTLRAWNRSADPRQRLRTIMTFNPPPNIHSAWVVEMFIPWMAWLFPTAFDYDNPASPGTVRYFAMEDGTEVERPNGEAYEFASGDKTETVYPMSRTYLHFTKEDNTYYGEEYWRNLQSIPEPRRTQLLYGDMAMASSDDVMQLIPTAWVKAAMERWREMAATASGKPEDDQGKPYPLSGMGVDVARGGADRTLIGTAYGLWIDKLIERPGASTPDGQAVLRLMQQYWDGNAPIMIDVIGVGSSPYDLARNDGLRIYGVHNGASSHARDKSGKYGFQNVRAELYWKLREALDPANPEAIALPPDKELLQELTAHHYEEDGRNLRIESKDDIKDRIGRSPDKADCVTLTLKALRKSL